MYQTRDLILRELARTEKAERALLAKRRKEKPFIPAAALEQKIPTGLQTKLDAAFASAFALIFEKGVGVIEKSYPKNRIVKAQAQQAMEARLLGSRPAVRAAAKAARRSGAANRFFCTASGVGMGTLGMGLPDIPLFTGFLLKSIYQTALHYGCDYDSESEQLFILLVIQGALCRNEMQDYVLPLLNGYVETGRFDSALSLKAEIKITANLLSCALLYPKLLQGIPLIGAVGGMADGVFLEKIDRFAQLKYRQRYLRGLLNPTSE